jgi:hypothetical protein
MKKWIVLLLWGMSCVSGSAQIVFDQYGLAYNGTQDGGNLGPQTIVLSSNGGTINWNSNITYVSGGGGWLSVTPSSGTVSPGKPVTLTFKVNIAGLAPISTHAIFEVNPGQQQVHTFLDVYATGTPVINRNGVVNGASFNPDAVNSPGGIASMFGTTLAPSTEAASSIPLPTTLANTQVIMDGQVLPLYFVSPSQINFQLPQNSQLPAVAVWVVSHGVQGPLTQVQIADQAPGIFAGAVLNQDFSANSAANPAAANSVIQIFAT